MADTYDIQTMELLNKIIKQIELTSPKNRKVFLSILKEQIEQVSAYTLLKFCLENGLTIEVKHG